MNTEKSINEAEGNAVLPLVSVSLRDLKLINTLANEVYHNLVSSNNPTHDEWCSSPKNLKHIMNIISKSVSNER
jgi:hypothetical protein